MRVLFLFSTLFVSEQIIAQDTLAVSKPIDSLVQNHSPKLASLLSAAIPGAGQIYNRKYWKLPIVYAGIGAGVYFIQKNAATYNTAKSAYLDRQAGVTPSTSDFDLFTDAQLLTEIETRRRQTELAIIGTAAIYVLQIVDASVDAHLFYFDVSDDLSLNFSPNLYRTQFSNHTFAGLSLSLHF